MNRTNTLSLTATLILSAFASSATAAVTCDPDNGGLKLPAGFCAMLASDGVGSARHIAAAPNGDVYVGIMGRRGGGVVALRPDENGRLGAKESFGTGSTTGVAVRNGYVYSATTTSVVRWKLTPGTLKPTGEMETVVADLPEQNEHQDKGLTFDGKGSLYINVGAPSNACQTKDRTAKDPGQNPCPILELHGGIWKFDENKLNQKQSDGVRFATGLRQMPAITWHDGAVWIAMNSRDQLDTLWGDMFSHEENADRPAEPLYRAVQGDNFGWPFCFFDYGLQKYILNPEYGGDGKKTEGCEKFKGPEATFPAHWAPVDIAFYDAKQFPAKYQGGAFVAFHGSWNRMPLPQDGFYVAFQPFANGKASGKYEIFADGFKGDKPVTGFGGAVARPDGVAVLADGSLYITESQKGKIWRVFYKGN